MNYYEALELAKEGKPTGLYHMTRTNDGITHTIGYCYINQKAGTPCQHHSAIEAADCYRKYCMEQQNGMMAGFMDRSEPGTELHITSSY